MNDHSEIVALAEMLAAANGGRIPSYTWLRKHGHQALIGMLRTKGHLFAHLTQETVATKSVDLAERLTAANGGQLQNCRWLIDNGFRALANHMRRHPELYRHIQQVCLVKRLDEAVLTAERLAEQNGKRVPTEAWLMANGFSWLASRMRSHPEAFEHLEKECAHLTDEEAASYAERLAYANGGSLPSPQTLRNSGIRWLNDRILAKPELFQHIPRQRFRKRQTTDDEVRTIAQRLANENGGLLPRPAWLFRNGYQFVAARMYRNPALLAHIKRES